MRREDFIERAQALVPTLLERGADAEAARRMPDETHRDFVDAGFYRMFQPARFGGAEMDWALMLEVACEVGRGCGSSCWNLTNLAVQGWINGMADPEAQEELWRDRPETLIASAFPARGATMRRVDGGLNVDGTWSFASGVDFADWINLQIFLPQEGAPPEHYFALVPKSDYRVVDDWFPSGMAATGSRSIVMEDVFIPEHRALPAPLLRGGGSPGSAVNPATLYKLPLFSIGFKHFSGTAIGIARGAVELIENDMRERTTVTGIRLAEQQSVYLRIAESGADVDAARALLLSDCAEADLLAEQDIEPTLDKRLTWRRNDSYACQLSVRAVERLYALTGGRALALDNPFQRAWRDVHAAVQQVLLAWDANATNYGKVRLGLPFSNPRL